MKRRIQFGVMLALLVLAVPSRAQERNPQIAEPPREAQALILDGAVIGEPVAARAGEICLLCNNPIAESDITYLVRGQRVPVHRIACDAKLRENPRVVLARLQPRGAFLGAEKESPALSAGWFVFGVYVLLGLFFGALCAHRALSVGRGPVAWFLVGFLSNIVGYAVLRSLPPRHIELPAGIPPGLGKIAVTRAPAACPACGSAVHPSATRCAACGAMLQPNVTSEVTLAARAN